MGTIVRKFAGTSDPELSHLNLGRIPRVGDHIVMDTGLIYCVTQILWDAGAGGLGDILVYLDPVLQCGWAAADR
jgi:hypothetical protein